MSEGVGPRRDAGDSRRRTLAAVAAGGAIGSLGRWAAALAALLDDPAAARGLGARAREWVLGHRTWAANARRYDALYRRLGVTAPSA